MAAAPRRKDGRQRKGKRTPGSGQTSAKEIARVERRAQAVELRIQGWGYEAIARALVPPCSTATAYNLVEEALSERQTPLVEKYRQITLERLEALLTGVMPAAMQGDLAAVQSALSIIKDQRQITGMDSPMTFRAGKRDDESTDSVAVEGQLPQGGTLQVVFVQAQEGRPLNGDGAKVIEGSTN